VRRAIRILKLASLLASGTLTLLFLFPFLDRDERDRRLVRWAGRLLAIIGGRLKVEGQPPVVRGGGTLIAANHVSWLDIHALHSVLPARFISKSDIRHWPLIGWMAEATGTLFLERGRKRDAARMNIAMADHLRAGECLAFFPEGTTSDGTDLLPFYPSLLQPAIEAEIKVWPLAIRYLDEHGRYNPVPAYFGGMSLLESLLRILRQPFFYVELTFLPPVTASGRHRRDLVQELEAAIRGVLAGDGRDMTPGTAARPQA